MPQALSPMSDDDRAKLALLLLWAFERNYPVLKTGSRVIGGATNESDWDYVVEVKGPTRGSTRDMENMGFIPSSNQDPTDPSNPLGVYGNRMTYATYRYGALNIVFVIHKDAFRNWVLATELAKAARPVTKQQRIQIFDAVFETPSRGPMYLLEDITDGGPNDAGF